VEFILKALDIFLHLDSYLDSFFTQYGMAAYVIVFLIIFCETGLVVTPFLPGDSLLFAIGALCAATASLNLPVMLVILPFAAITGNLLNYTIGYWIGPKIFKKEKARFFSKKNIINAHNFYEKYGGFSVTISRFIPIFRTFVPFVSGIAKMTFIKFFLYNILGGLLWTLLFVFAGYFFGNIEFVKKNFEFVVVGIVFVSVIPVAIEFIKSKLVKNQKDKK
jgi:membrane-associated protein